jgi:hypothetical protein
MAKYIFLQYVDESKAPRPGTPEMQAVIDTFARYLEEIQAAGVLHDGDPCQPSSASFSVNVRDGHAKTTDPCMQTRHGSMATSSSTARTGQRRLHGQQRIQPPM